MLGFIFAKLPVVALTVTVTERTKCYRSSSLGIITAVNPNRHNINRGF